MANNLFCEPELGHVAHNRTSLVMLEDENLANWVGLYTVDLFLPVGNTVPAMQKWPGSQELTETVCVEYPLTIFIRRIQTKLILVTCFFNRLSTFHTVTKTHSSTMSRQTQPAPRDMTSPCEPTGPAKVSTCHTQSRATPGQSWVTPLL